MFRALRRRSDALVASAGMARAGRSLRGEARVAVAVLVGCAAPPPEVPEDEASPLAVLVEEEVGRSRRSVGSPRVPVEGPLPLELARSYALDWERVPRLEAHPRTDAIGSLSFVLEGFASSTGLTHLLNATSNVQNEGCRDAEPVFVRWESFPSAAKEPASLRYSRFDGMTASCRVQSQHAYQAEVPALVPGLVYAFKTCDSSGCDAGARQPGSLVLVAPEPTFVESLGSARPATPHARSGSFGRVEVPLVRGGDGASVATLTFTGTDVLAWRKRRGLPPPKANEVELSESRLLSIRVEATTIGGATELQALLRVNGQPGRRLVEWLEAAPARTP
jgi:hypothetical protein